MRVSSVIYHRRRIVTSDADARGVQLALFELQIASRILFLEHTLDVCRVYPIGSSWIAFGALFLTRIKLQ